MKPGALRHSSDAEPGLTRRRRGKGFEYRTSRGRPASNADKERIRSLAIPPAWERVWICADPDAHLQATGYDARGRKQYRYHPAWRELRNSAKFDDLMRFGENLPRVRRRVRSDLRKKAMSREKVVACVVWLLDETHIRIGNAEYARDNGSYGLTTILNEHAKVAGSQVKLQFRAKSGVACATTIQSPRAAKIIRKCQELPGQELFCYVDTDGVTRDITSSDVNSYIQNVTGEAFTSKHFRTWGGSVAAAEKLWELWKQGPPKSQREQKRRQIAAIDAAAEHLCNTRAVCRKYYIHPRVLTSMEDQTLESAFEAAAAGGRRGLRTAERAMLELLGQDRQTRRRSSR